MSYDLFLKPRNGTLTLQQSADYFASRPCYQRDQNAFWYHNGDTGVYFSFFYLNEENRHPSRKEYPLQFNMTFYRPSFFAFEAEAELSGVVSSLDLTVSDPHRQGMADGEYDGERFLSGWHYGNGIAYQAAQELKENDREHIHVLTMSQKKLHGMWGWNRNRKRYQKHLGDSYYVPPIWAMKIEGRVTTATMWPDGIPSFIPKASFLIIPRDKFKPQKGTGPGKDMAIIPWEQVEHIIGKYSEKIQDDGYLINSYKQVPADVEDFIKNLPPSRAGAERVAFDSVLDLELWQSHASQ